MEDILFDYTKCMICQKDKPITAKGSAFWHSGTHELSPWYTLLGLEECFCDECFQRIESEKDGVLKV